MMFLWRLFGWGGGGVGGPDNVQVSPVSCYAISLAFGPVLFVASTLWYAYVLHPSCYVRRGEVLVDEATLWYADVLHASCYVRHGCYALVR